MMDQPSENATRRRKLGTTGAPRLSGLMGKNGVPRNGTEAMDCVGLTPDNVEAGSNRLVRG
jgi:hypothetical protein